jgi:hypothetical protein
LRHPGVVKLHAGDIFIDILEECPAR